MTKLQAIQSTAQAVAEAISAAIGVETEIVDIDLNIVAGTGRYFHKIGTVEEGGSLNSGEIYGVLLSTGNEYIVEDAQNDPIYLGLENELAEVCCPIKIDDQIIGLIGLVAFDEEQRKRIVQGQQSLLNFTRKMASLLASKAVEVAISNKMEIVLKSIRDGVISVDQNGIIESCNVSAERLIGRAKEKLIGKSILEIWNDSPVMDAIQTGKGYENNEEIYIDAVGNTMHFHTTVTPVFLEDDSLNIGHEFKCIGAVISFRHIDDVRKILYTMTEEKESCSFDEILGISQQIQDLKELAQKIANGISTILISGESGTGKGLLAKAIHFHSNRSTNPFISVNCGAIPDTLIESELFGYEGGGFYGSKNEWKAREV